MAELFSLADREAFLEEADGITYADVVVPEFKDKSGEPRVFRVRAMTIDESTKHQASIVTVDKRGRTRINSDDAAVKLLSLVVIDPASGERIFNPSHFDRMRRKSAAGFSRLLKIANDLSAIDEDDIERLKNA